MVIYMKSLTLALALVVSSASAASAAPTQTSPDYHDSGWWVNGEVLPGSDQCPSEDSCDTVDTGNTYPVLVTTNV